MADERIVIDVTQALAEIAKLRGGMVDVQAQAAKTGKSVGDAFNVGFGQGMADSLNDLQKEYDDLKRSSATLKNALKSATDPTLVDQYVKSIAQLELGMKRLENAGKQAGVNLKDVNKAAGTGKQVFEGLVGAITKVTVILAVIDAVVKFTKYAVELSQQISTAKKTFEAFTGSAKEADKIINSLIVTGQKNFIPTDDILQAGKALLAFGENADNLPDVLGRIADISAATGKDFNELTTIYGKARAAGVLYAEDINQLVDAGIPIIQEFAKQMGVSNDQVKKLASEGKISFEELQLAMFNLTAEGGKFANQSQVQSDSIAGAWKKAVASVQPGLEAIGSLVGDLVQGVIEGFTITNEAIKGLFSDTPGITIDYSGRDAYEQAKDDLLERQRLEEEAEKARRERNKKAAAEAEAIEKQRQQAIINGMKEGVQKEIAQENFRYRLLLKELKKFHLDTTEATEQHNKNLDEIGFKEVDRQYEALQKSLELRKRINELDIKNAEEAEKKRKDGIAAQVDDLEAIRDLKNQEVDIAEQAGEALIIALKNQGADENQIKEAQRQLDLEIQKARLQNELDFQLALFDTIDGGDEKRLQSVLNTIQIIQGKIANIDAQSGGSGGKKKSLLERLGFDKDSIEQLKDASKEIIGALQDITSANVDAADEQLRIAEDRTQAAQEALDAEKKRQEDGFANNVDLKQRELDQAKQDEAKALAQKKAAQRQQLVLDSALQLSGLITTSVNILKGWSTIPFVGQVLGVTAVAAMFAAFAATRARAFAATKLKHGGQGKVDGNSIIVGPSHDNDGVGIEAEGGEFFGTDGKRFGVVNKKMTSKHFDLLAAINKDDKAGMVAAVSRITMNRDAVNGAIGEGKGSVVVIGAGNADTNKILNEWREESKSKPTRTVEGNYIVERRGNYTRKIRVKQ